MAGSSSQERQRSELVPPSANPSALGDTGRMLVAPYTYRGSRRSMLAALGGGFAASILAACGSRPSNPGVTPSLNPTSVPTKTETTPVNGSTITIENGQFVRGGKPIGFVGENCYPLATSGSTANVCGPTMDSNSRREWINTVASLGMNVVRFWDFAALTSKGQDFSATDEILGLAAQNGILLYPTLDNQWKDCTGGPDKDDAWYEGGYKDTYLPFVRAFTQRYKGNSNFLGFQLMNEAQCSDPAVLQAFASDVISAIREIDPTRLITIGILGSGQPGVETDDDFRKLMDLCDFVDIHEYPSSENGTYQGLPGDPYHGIYERMQLTQTLNKPKPLIISEMGRPQTGDLQTGADADRSMLQQLLKYRNFAGVIGWDLITPGFQHTVDGYGYPASSPEAQMLKLLAPQIINPQT